MDSTRRRGRTHPRLGRTGERICRPDMIWRLALAERTKRQRSVKFRKLREKELEREIEGGTFLDPQLQRWPDITAQIRGCLDEFGFAWEARGASTVAGPFILTPSLISPGKVRLKALNSSEEPGVNLPPTALRLGPYAKFRMKHSRRREPVSESGRRRQQRAGKRLGAQDDNARRLMTAQRKLGPDWPAYLNAYRTELNGHGVSVTLREMRRIVRGWRWAAEHASEPSLSLIPDESSDYCQGEATTRWQRVGAALTVSTRSSCRWEEKSGGRNKKTHRKVRRSNCALSGLENSGGMTTLCCPRTRRVWSWINQPRQQEQDAGS